MSPPTQTVIKNGVLVGKDNHVMWWDLQRDVHRIEYFDENGVCQTVLSGVITEKKLLRAKAKFRKEHGESQKEVYKCHPQPH